MVRKSFFFTTTQVAEMEQVAQQTQLHIAEHLRRAWDHYVDHFHFALVREGKE